MPSNEKNRSRSQRTNRTDSETDEFIETIKSRLEKHRKLSEVKSQSSKQPISNDLGFVKAEWGSLKKPIWYDRLSKWVSQDDFEWAKSVGIYVYPKGFTSEEGITILAPELSRSLEVNLPVDKDLTAQDVAMGILNSIASVRPDLSPKDLIRAFAFISSAKIGLQNFPYLWRTFMLKR